MRVRPIGEMVKAGAAGWVDDNVPRMAAALAYYTVFALAPLLMIAIGVAGQIFGRQAAEGRVVDAIAGTVGERSAVTIQTMLVATRTHFSGVAATAVGVVTLFLGATGVFSTLQGSLNTIWRVRPRSGRTMRRFLETRFLSFAMVLGIGFLLLVSLLLSAGLSAVGAYARELLPVPEVLLQAASALTSFGVITFLFAMIYKVLPDVTISWRDVWVGATITAILFTLGKFLLGLYLGRSLVASTYGAAGALILVLVWVYYSANIVLLGAEMTRAYATCFGSPIRPDRDAEPLDPAAAASLGLPPGDTQLAPREPVGEPPQRAGEAARTSAASRSHPSSRSGR